MDDVPDLQPHRPEPDEPAVDAAPDEPAVDTAPAEPAVDTAPSVPMTFRAAGQHEESSERAEQAQPELSVDPEVAEAALLEDLEGDLAAVEEAMRSLDRIAAEAGGGEAAAAQIATVVSTARFPEAAPVAHVDLTGEPLRSKEGSGAALPGTTPPPGGGPLGGSTHA